MKIFNHKLLSLCLLSSALVLSACGGGGSSSTDTTTPTPTPVTTAIPAAWVGTWKDSLPCETLAYTRSGGGNYYGASDTITISSDGGVVSKETLFDNNTCTIKAGVITKNGKLSDVSTLAVSGYSSAATALGTETGISISADGGTGINLSALPTLDAPSRAFFAINSSGQLCSDGTEAQDFPNNPTAQPFCRTKQ